MRKARSAALGAAVTTVLALGLGAGTAQSATGASDERAAAQAAPRSAANTQVHAWTFAHVRTGPNTHSKIISHVNGGYTYEAICWTYGEKITYKGYTNSRWVLLDRTWPKQNGYVTAIALSGGKTGGVSKRC